MLKNRNFTVLLVFFASLFIASCADEVNIILEPMKMLPETQPPEIAEEPVVVTGVTDILQPTKTTVTQSPQVPVEPVAPVLFEEPVVVEESKVSFKDNIQPILSERCALPGCHAAPGIAGLDLSKYSTLKRGSAQSAVIVAGNGKGSLIVRRIDGGGMPPGGPPLDVDQIQLIIDWIDEGAKDN